ncbi:MAG: Hsp20/alpha crystallin family protein [Persephonella sp.]|nr:MAG: Hsp20/alpha crystallin family protein [Persephonella sp.]RUM60389.1 MAG: Hsp20/alpha crystallin family protein [Persephonella sp.]
MERRQLPASFVWNPFRELARIEQELNKLFNEFVPAQKVEGVAIAPIIPRVDVYETEDKVIVEAEIPGVKKEDIEVKVKDNNVIIKGEIKREEEKQDKNFFKAERFYGKFERVIPLMVEVKPEEAKAKIENGILRLEIPKATAEKEISIKVE